MTLRTSSMGLMANHRNIINASDYSTADSRIVQASGYADDDYVQCVVADTPMIEIGPLPDLSLVGPYKIYIHGFTGTSTSDYLDCYLDVYEDGELVVWDTGTHTTGELVIQTHTPEVWLTFDPDKEYRLVIRTGASTTDANPTVIDYIHLQQLDYQFDDSGLWEYHEGLTITGGAPTATYNITTALPVITSTSAAHLQVVGYNEGTIRSAITSIASASIDLAFAAVSGNLPATFYAWISVWCVIELPYVRGHGDV